MNPPLVFDRRKELGASPGMHAFIVGVSAYPNLPKDDEAPTANSYGMRQLSSTALTAYRIFRWLEQRCDRLATPLATVRLLVTPSAEELAVEQDMGGLTSLPATLHHFLKAADGWRTDAARSDDQATLFYFAGHGIQRTRGDAVLLLEGFGNGVGGALHHAVDIHSLYYGMTPSPVRQHIAQTQLYFIDACRILPSEFKKFEQMPTTPVFDVELSGQDNRRAPVYYAAIPGAKAYGIRGEQTIFSKALLDCLEGGAGEAEEDEKGRVRWFVSAASLNRALELRMEELNSQHGAEQEFVPGASRDVKINFLNDTPLVDVALEIGPPEAVGLATVVVINDQGTPVAGIPNPLHPPRPYRTKLPAGFYQVGAMMDSAEPKFMSCAPQTCLVRPPSLQWRRSLAPG